MYLFISYANKMENETNVYLLSATSVNKCSASWQVNCYIRHSRDSKICVHKRCKIRKRRC